MQRAHAAVWLGVLLTLALTCGSAIAGCRARAAPEPSAGGSYDGPGTTDCGIQATSIAESAAAFKAYLVSQESRAMDPADARWYTAQLTDARTGRPFSLAGLRGKPVLVEPMAVWCALCLKQQEQMRRLEEKGTPDVVMVSLDIDPNEDAEALARHAAAHGLDWHWAIAPKAMVQALQGQFGVYVRQPPATPMVLLNAQGEARLLPLGVKSAEQLAEEIAAAPGK